MTAGAEADRADEEAGPASPRKEPAVPTVAEVLRRGWLGAIGGAFVVGLGVLAMPCVGIGAIFLWIGSRELLVMSARGSGAPERTPGWLAAFYAVVLALLLAGGALLGMLVVGITESGGLPLLASASLSVMITAVVGAALSPLAYAPIASACGARGWIEPLTRAIDVAGRDRLLTLAPLCAAIGLFLLLPIPLVAYGAEGLLSLREAPMVVGALALAVWLAAVPASAAVLTVRYRRLEHSGDSPTTLRRALSPILGAYAIGGAALAVSLAAAAATPLKAQPAWAVSLPASEGHRIGSDRGPEPPPFKGALASAHVSNGRLYVGGFPHVHGERYGPVIIEVGRDARCTAYRGPAGDAVAECVSPKDGAVRVSFDPEGRIVGASVPVRIAARLGAAPIAGLAVAVLLLAIALAWLGRVGASLRLLARPPFALEGTLRGEPGSDDGRLFVSADGQVQVRVPPRCIDAAPGRSVAESDPAELLSPVSVAAMTYRTAPSSLPAGAIVVAGAREEALARRIARARRRGFRMGLLGLLALLWASGAILMINLISTLS